MGILGAITAAAAPVVDKAKDVVHDGTEAAKDLGSAVATGADRAGDAVAGAAESATKQAPQPVKDATKAAADVVRNPGGAAVQVAKGAIDHAPDPVRAAVGVAKAAAGAAEDVGKTAGKAAGKAVDAVGKVAGDGVEAAGDAAEAVTKRVPEPIKDAAGSVAGSAQDGADKVGKAWNEHAPEPAKAAGRWAWEHQGELAFWVGTTALLAAVPVTGGASGAVAGGLMATRGVALGAKVAQMGSAGRAAAGLARGGASMLQGARSAAASTRVGGALARGSAKLYEGRQALGATRVGTAMTKAARPANWAFNGLTGVYFGTEATKMANGTGSARGMGMASLYMVPLVAGGAKAASAIRSSAADRSAARLATAKADEVGSMADAAAAKLKGLHDYEGLAAQAPRAFVKTDNAADQARRISGDVADMRRIAGERLSAAGRSKAPPHLGMTPQMMASRVDDVGAKANDARLRLAEARNLAPDQVGTTAAAAERDLAAVSQKAYQAKIQLARKQATQEQAARASERADQVTTTANDAATRLLIAQNVQTTGLGQSRPVPGDASSALDEGNLGRYVLSELANLNARTAARAPG